MTEYVLALLTDVTDHTDDLVGAHDASAISVTPAGTIASTTVQAALEELDSELNALITAQDLDFAGDSGVGSVDLDSQVLGFAANNNSITFNASGQTIGLALADVLEDLDTLGPSTTDGEFLVATGVGALAWESGATARTSLGVYSTAEVDTLHALTVLLAGRAGGQTVEGGTASGEDLVLSSTSNATKGTVRIGDATIGLFYDEVNDRLALGADEHAVTVGAASIPLKLVSHVDGTAVAGAFHAHADGTGLLTGSVIYGARSRGTEGAETIVVDDGYLLSLVALGHDGTDYAQGARIDFLVDGTPGAGDMPTRMEFLTSADGGETPVLALTIDSAQIANFVNKPLVGGSDALLDTADIGVTVQGYDVDTLFADTTDALSAGFSHTPSSAGTKSSGTYTPAYADGNFQYATNGGAHTLAPQTGAGQIMIEYTNNASADTITTSGYTKVDGTQSTTNTQKYFAISTVHQNYSHLQWIDLN